MKTKYLLSSLALCASLAGSALADPTFADEGLAMLNDANFHASDVIVDVRGEKADASLKDKFYASFAEIDTAVNAALSNVTLTDCPSNTMDLKLVVVGSDGALAMNDKFLVSVKDNVGTTVGEDAGLENTLNLVSMLGIDNFSTRTGLVFAISTESGTDVPADEGIKFGITGACKPMTSPMPTFAKANLDVLGDSNNFHPSGAAIEERADEGDAEKPGVYYTDFESVKTALTAVIQSATLTDCETDTMELKLVVVGSNGALATGDAFVVNIMNDGAEVDSDTGEDSDLAVPMVLNIPSYNNVKGKLSFIASTKNNANVPADEGIKLGITGACKPADPPMPTFAKANLALFNKTGTFHTSGTLLSLMEYATQDQTPFVSNFADINSKLNTEINKVALPANCTSDAVEVKFALVGSSAALAADDQFVYTISNASGEITSEDFTTGMLDVAGTYRIPNFKANMGKLLFSVGTKKQASVPESEGLKYGLTAACAAPDTDRSETNSSAFGVSASIFLAFLSLVFVL